jgi:hypothetical protein
VKPTRAKNVSFSSVFDSGFEPGAGECHLRMMFSTIESIDANVGQDDLSVNADCQWEFWTHHEYLSSCATSKGQILELADGKSRDERYRQKHVVTNNFHFASEHSSLCMKVLLLPLQTAVRTPASLSFSAFTTRYQKLRDSLVLLVNTDHTCDWICVPIYLHDIKFYIIAVTGLPIYQIGTFILAVWVISHREHRDHRQGGSQRKSKMNRFPMNAIMFSKSS